MKLFKVILFTDKGGINIDCVTVGIYIYYVDYKWSVIDYHQILNWRGWDLPCKSPNI